MYILAIRKEEKAYDITMLFCMCVCLVNGPVFMKLAWAWLLAGYLSHILPMWDLMFWWQWLRSVLFSVMWLTSHSLVHNSQCFGRTCFFHLQGREDGGGRFLRNVSEFLPYYMASHHRRQQSSCLLTLHSVILMPQMFGAFLVNSLAMLRAVLSLWQYILFCDSDHKNSFSQIYSMTKGIR